MTLKEVFGKNMRYYRYKKGLTQEKFAEKVDLNPSYISEIESGKYGPKFEKIELISKVLEIEPHILFQETKNTHKQLPNRVDMK
ncbi:MAG: helix-turn-helix transcriptional regulator [Bacilli bacterium]|nr:helix-turn-helix transcriptional regulator [Bacilli bacterium]